MDELDNEPDNPDQRPTVKELVARIQRQHPEKHRDNDNSESSDDEDSPIRFSQQLGPMGDSNVRHFEAPPSEMPRSRSGVYNADLGGSSFDPGPSRHLEPTVIVDQGRGAHDRSSDSDGPKYYNQHGGVPAKYVDLNSRFAKLRVLDGRNNGDGAGRLMDGGKIFESTARMLENVQDTADRDTNNDSGYSTKVYGSSKGNSPSLSGQLEGEIPGAASSLVWRKTACIFPNVYVPVRWVNFKDYLLIINIFNEMNKDLYFYYWICSLLLFLFFFILGQVGFELWVDFEIYGIMYTILINRKKEQPKDFLRKFFGLWIEEYGCKISKRLVK